MQIKAEFYRWGDGQTPDWAANALADGTIRIDGDGDGFLVSGDGTRLRINSGDYLMQSMSVIFLVAADVYEAMMMAVDGEAPRRTPRDLDAPNGLGDPPYSPTVLARSARAREKQAAWDRDGKPKPSEPENDNAHVEGADVPDEHTETADHP